MIISHKKILLIMFLFFIPLVSIYAQDSTIIINVTLKLVSNSDEAIDGAKVELFSKESKSELIQRTSDKLGMCVFSMKITDLDTYTRVRVYIDNIVIHEDEISLDVTKLVKIDDNTQALPTIQLKISMPEDISKIKNQIVAGLINQARKLIATDRTEENFELALGFARQAKSTNDKQKNPDPAVDKFVAEIFEMYLQYLYSEEKVKEGLDLLAKLLSDLPKFSKLNEWQDRFNLKTLPEDVRTKYLEALNAVETGDAETAIMLFSELVKIKDTVIPYYQEIFASQLSVSQDMVVSKILEQALREYEKGDYDKALQFLSQISKYTEKVSPAALAIEEVVRQKLGINSRKETPKNNQSGFLKCELEPLGKNPQGYEEFTRSTDGMVVVMIPAREITIGDLNGIGDTDEIPTKNLKLRPFYYDKYEISNAQYCAFLNAINSRGLIVRFYNLDSVSAQIEFKNGVYSPKPGKADYPVQNISWYGSNAYSLWAWGHNWRDFEGADCLLPTDAMYECVSVCTPDKKLIYPWGDDFNQDNVVCGREKLYQWDVVPTVKTTEYTQSASYCGILNLCGNVYEWMANAGAKTYYDNRHAEINFFLRQINSEHPKDYFVKLREHITKFMEKNKAFIEKDEGYTKQFEQMTETLDKIIKDKKDDNKTEDFTLPEFLYPNDGGNEFDASNYSKVDDYTREYRGGGFTSGASKVRCTYRGRDYPSKQKHYLGFRTAIFAETLETHEIDPESLPQAKFDPIVVGFEYLGVNNQGFREFRRPKDGMVMIEVPAGDFIMGSEVVIDAKPEHLVPLDMYLIDKYEISNAQFDKFLKEYGSYRVKDGEYVDEFIIKESLWGFLKDKDGKLQIAGDKDAPVVGVTWYGAQEYAKWAKAELPSEAQWEKAARKDNTGSYAWGSEDPDETRANFNGTYTLRPLKVNALEKGVSPYGCFNMSGNVWEWCQDYYDDEFYASADSKKLNPINLKVPKYAGTKNKNTSKMTYHRIARGGGSNSEPTNLRTYVRESAYENTGSQYLGFRCCYNGKEKVIDQEDRESGETTTPEEDSTEKKTDESASAKKAEMWRFANFPTNKTYGGEIPEQFDVELIKKREDGIEFYKRNKDGMTVVRVPGGYFKVGDVFNLGTQGERVSKYIWVPEFFMDTTEISNAQFCMFLNNVNTTYFQAASFYNFNTKNPEISLTAEGYKVLNYRDDYPVRNVTFAGANAYSMWVWNQGYSNYDNNSCLPTEAMYEKAASYNWDTQSKHIFPFGDEVVSREEIFINCTGFCTVNHENVDVSFLGVKHLSDNVSEWCVDAYTGETCGLLHQLSVELPQREHMLEPPLMGRVIKGASINEKNIRNLRCSYRKSLPEDSSSAHVGFRCAFTTGFNLSPTKSKEDDEINLHDKFSTKLDVKEISANYQKMNRFKRKIDNMIMIQIESGDYNINKTNGELTSVHFPKFLIDETEVTVKMFCNFLNEYSSNRVKDGIYKGKIILLDETHVQISKLKDEMGYIVYAPKKGWELRPVTDVSWYGAYEYAKWVGCELPTEAQFEAAARGTTQNIYPWGDDKPTYRHANYKIGNRISLPSKVGSYRLGNSVFGVKDLSGNVWEWCMDYYHLERETFENGEFPCDYRFSDKVVIKGGCYNSTPKAIGISTRRGLDRDLIYSLVGFRCVYNFPEEISKDANETNIR